MRILVAEDDSTIRQMMATLLSRCGFDCRSVDNGRKAVEAWEDESFDFIFMDVQMPNLDGIQSTKLIREIGFSAPIVALTAFAEKSNEDECMASGMDYFLAKPIRRPKLKEVLRRYAPIYEEDIERNPLYREAASLPQIRACSQ